MIDLVVNALNLLNVDEWIMRGTPKNEKEFEQTCDLVERSRVHNNGPADYRKSSPTSIWMKQKTKEILRQMVKKRKNRLEERGGSPPEHIQENDENIFKLDSKQDTLWK